MRKILFLCMMILNMTICANNDEINRILASIEQNLSLITHLYVQLDKEVFKKQEVHIGLSDGERVRILSGLKEGDRVVTKGTYQVKLAATASVIPEGHSHAH